LESALGVLVTLGVAAGGFGVGVILGTGVALGAGEYVA
jgi:hypothetical protein